MRSSSSPLIIGSLTVFLKLTALGFLALLVAAKSLNAFAKSLKNNTHFYIDRY